MVSNPAKVSARLAMGVTVKEELTCSPTLLTCRISWLGPEPPPNMLVRLEAVTVAGIKKNNHLEPSHPNQEKLKKAFEEVGW